MNAAALGSEGEIKVHVDQRKIGRAIVGGFIGMAVGFLIALLIYGLQVADALVAFLWCLPFIAVIAFMYVREKPDGIERHPGEDE